MTKKRTKRKRAVSPQAQTGTSPPPKKRRTWLRLRVAIPVVAALVSIVVGGLAISKEIDVSPVKRKLFWWRYRKPAFFVALSVQESYKDFRDYIFTLPAHGPASEKLMLTIEKEKVDPKYYEIMSLSDHRQLRLDILAVLFSAEGKDAADVGFWTDADGEIARIEVRVPTRPRLVPIETRNVLPFKTIWPRIVGRCNWNVRDCLPELLRDLDCVFLVDGPTETWVEIEDFTEDLSSRCQLVLDNAVLPPDRLLSSNGRWLIGLKQEDWHCPGLSPFGVHVLALKLGGTVLHHCCFLRRNAPLLELLANGDPYTLPGNRRNAWEHPVDGNPERVRAHWRGKPTPRPKCLYFPHAAMPRLEGTYIFSWQMRCIDKGNPVEIPFQYAFSLLCPSDRDPIRPALKLNTWMKSRTRERILLPGGVSNQDLLLAEGDDRDDVLLLGDWPDDPTDDDEWHSYAVFLTILRNSTEMHRVRISVAVDGELMGSVECDTVPDSAAVIPGFRYYGNSSAEFDRYRGLYLPPAANTQISHAHNSSEKVTVVPK